VTPWQILKTILQWLVEGRRKPDRSVNPQPSETLRVRILDNHQFPAENHPFMALSGIEIGLLCGPVEKPYFHEVAQRSGNKKYAPKSE